MRSAGKMQLLVKVATSEASSSFCSDASVECAALFITMFTAQPGKFLVSAAVIAAIEVAGVPIGAGRA
jgi:hypothetical protein